ncbi:uncharacterized protein EV422DRAFT_493257 [Fimicolochytrium jonesii]|uniref:uncharacterized protein n=1 Tax=Fimicolochytrium jonesii TaxID=1396493 RepID=UPI0022FE3BFD|nr:uncharacterized protein EV422DRAFT_493257 [Fimicolochytrium jonesii]KAI8824459.1 hypothetical protein EV422DRAFT_493257 [Fimicolochytrium jonesii]
MHALQLASTGRNTTDHQARIDYLRKVIEGWFLGADFFSIKRENFQSWVAWAFLDEDLALLDKENRHQVDKLTKIIERACEHSFPPGNNPDLKCIRLTLDAVQATHRPLIYYIVCKSVNALSHLLLRGIGFRLRELQRKHVPGSGKLTYLYRPAKEPMPEGALPIVFIHGIGIGFAAYVPFLLCLPRNVPVYLLEWPHVSMQLTEEVPTIEETMAFLVAMLDTDQQEKATFVAHSLGTIAVAWMLRSESHRQRVGSVVLLDPVTFVLCDPTIAYNFLHRPPSNSLELIMQYFVSREMYIANSLSRHFHWSKNILFYDNLPHPQDGLKHVVSLSGVDAIVPSPRVKLYLDTCAEMDGYRNPVDVIYHDEQNHGEMLFRLPFLRLIMERIREACGSIPSQPPMSVSGEFQSPPQSFVNTPKSVKSSPPHNMKLRSHARRPAASPSPVASVDAAAPVVVTSTATSRGRSNSKAPRLSVIA